MTTTARDAMTEAGKATIRAERQAAKAARREVEELRAQLTDREERDQVQALARKAERLGRELTAATERAEAAEARLDVHLLRLAVAVRMRLPAELIDRLRGDTEAELAADADALLTLRDYRPRGSSPRLRKSEQG